MKKLHYKTRRYGIAFNKLDTRFSNGLFKDVLTDNLKGTLEKAVDGELVYGMELLRINTAYKKEKWHPDFPHMIATNENRLKKYERLFPTFDEARDYLGTIDPKILKKANPDYIDIFMVERIAEFKNNSKRYIFTRIYK